MNTSKYIKNNIYRFITFECINGIDKVIWECKTWQNESIANLGGFFWNNIIDHVQNKDMHFNTQSIYIYTIICIVIYSRTLPSTNDML